MMTNKIALVTGGSRGLGRDMALSLAAKGIDVILSYHSKEDEAEEVVAAILDKGQKATALRFDAEEPKSLDHFIESVSDSLHKNWNTDKLDFLINNAGIGISVMMSDMTEEIFDRLLNIHLKSVYFLTQKILSRMNDNGAVIFISSGTTRFSVPGYSVYAPMKGAVEVLSRYVAKEYGKRGIRSNVVAPGAIQTDFNKGSNRDNPERVARMAALTALGRAGNADDIGSVVAFLCTGDAKWVNGQRIEVTGGMNI